MNGLTNRELRKDMSPPQKELLLKVDYVEESSTKFTFQYLTLRR